MTDSYNAIYGFGPKSSFGIAIDSLVEEHYRVLRKLMAIQKADRRG
jgi:hypothetical protein